MKVPKHIEEKMHKLARLSANAKILSREIDAFFARKGINADGLRGIGCNADGKDYPDYLTDLENGIDVTDDLIGYVISEYSEF